MEFKRLTVSALAAVLAISGIGSILWIQHQPDPVEAVHLTDDRDPAIRREADDGPALQVVEDDDRGANDDDTGDGDATAGDDGTSGGNNTGDGDATAGDDGTSGGNNTGDGDATQDTRDADTTD